MSKKNKEMPVDDFQDFREEMDGHTEEISDEGDDAQHDSTAVDSLKNALEKEKEKFLRLFAEFENYKKRTSRERMELFKTAGQEVMISLLPVLDDFDRGIQEMEKSGDKDMITGVSLIHTKLKETLRLKGLEEMQVKQGDTFDAEIHEALTQIPAPSKKLKGKVIEVVEKGYSLGDKIIRHPKVVVGQ